MSLINKANNFKYVQNVATDNTEATILLYDVIGRFQNEDEEIEQGIDGQVFAQEILALQNNGVQLIKVRINSEGGNVLDGYSICSAILLSKVPVYTYCDGLAASIAGVILMCGHQKFIQSYGTLMLHNPSGAAPELLDLIKKTLVNILTNNTPLSESQISAIMDATTFFNAEEAKKMGLVDEIITSGTKIKIESTDLKELATIYNQLVKQDTNFSDTKMQDTENKLGIESPTTLTNDDEMMSDNINSNSDETKTIGEKEMKQKLGLADNASNDEMYNALDKILNEHKTFKASLDAIEKEKADKKETMITEMCNTALSLGKITNEELENTKILAHANFDATKNFLDKIGTKTAIKIYNQKDVLGKNSIDDKTTWSYKDYERKDPTGLKKIKNETPELFQRMLEESYPKKKNN